MIVFTYPVLIPILAATGLYYGFGLFLSDLNAFGAACMFGSAISALMEFAGLRGTVFFIPAAAWMGFFTLNQAFGLTDIVFIQSNASPGIALMIMSVITAILGVLSILGMFAGGSAAEESPA